LLEDIYRVLWIGPRVTTIVGRAPTYDMAILLAEKSMTGPFTWTCDADGRIWSNMTEGEFAGQCLIVEACSHCGSIAGWQITHAPKITVRCRSCKC